MKTIRNAARSTNRAVGASFFAVTTLLGITACSSLDTQYKIPRSLCGANVPQSVLESALPKGEKLTEHPESSGSTKRCRIHVDGKSVLSVSTERWEVETTASDVAQSALGVDPQDRRSNEGRYIYSSTGAVGKIDCTKANAVRAPMWATVRVTHHEATGADMLKLIRAYVKAVGFSPECSQ
ncbi:hypothetical protein [Streptomyces variegatus]|jgi:hypothetical protein|uniref:hypothetical protein n=1 Tax=Streptomyces variegatus TaxID=284040 RepID=UPI003C2BE850